MLPIKVEIIALLPEKWNLCNSCTTMLDQASLENPQESYPDEFQDQMNQLTGIVIKLSQLYGDRVLIRLIDPRTIDGLLKSIRHGIHRYPTFLIQGKEKVTHLDWQSIHSAIESVELRAISG